MPISDEELSRITEKLKTAFDAAAERYDNEVRRYGPGDKDARAYGSEMAALAVPYLQALQMQEARELRKQEEAERTLPNKSLRAAPNA